MATKIKKRTDEKYATRVKRKLRIRNKVSGNLERPRLSFFKGSRSIFVQLVDDENGKTLLGLSSSKGKTINRELASSLGKEFAQKAIAQGIKVCVFDRGGNAYHGRVEAFASGAREGGLNF